MERNISKYGVVVVCKKSEVKKPNKRKEKKFLEIFKKHFNCGFLYLILSYALSLTVVYTF